jgi:hypothetical protein
MAIGLFADCICTVQFETTVLEVSITVFMVSE